MSGAAAELRIPGGGDAGFLRLTALLEALPALADLFIRMLEPFGEFSLDFLNALAMILDLLGELPAFLGQFLFGIFEFAQA